MADRSWTSTYVDVQQLDSRVTPAEVRAADTALASVLDRWADAVADARVRLTGAGRGAPGLVQINVTVDGIPARVQVSGLSVGDAIAAAMRRLEWKLRHLAPVPASALATWPEARQRPMSIALPGRITRLKSVQLARTTPAAASRVLLAMDYDAHLFTDTATGEDAIIYRGGPTGLRLSRQRSMRPPAEQTQPVIVVHPQRPQTMSPEDAVDWLVDYDLPHVFFTDKHSRRGLLLHRRYDGHLALVTPEP